MSSQSIRLPDDLVEIARAEAGAMSRSISGQVEHWFRLGRIMESSPKFDYDRIRKALNGELPAGELNEEEDEIYWTLFSESMWNPDPSVDEYFAKLRADIEARGIDISELGDTTIEESL